MMKESLIVSIVILLVSMTFACRISDNALIKQMTDDAPIRRIYTEYDFSNDNIYGRIIKDAVVRSGFDKNDVGRFFCLSVYEEECDTICVVHYDNKPIDFSNTLDWDNKKNFGYTTFGNHFFLIRGEKKYFKTTPRLPHKKELNLYKSHYACIYDPEYLCYVIKGSTLKFLTYDEYVTIYHPEICDSISSYFSGVEMYKTP